VASATAVHRVASRQPPRPAVRRRSASAVTPSPKNSSAAGSIRSTTELEAAITSFIETSNANPKPFIWTKSADDILATIKRFCLATLRLAQTQTSICKTSETGH
jgi:hypothetical protein